MKQAQKPTPFADLNNRINPHSPRALTDEELWDVIDSVRDSYFLGSEDGDTIEDCLTDFFDGMTPEWLAFQSPDGTCYVNAAGISGIDDDDTEIALQFEMSDDLRSFSLVAMTVGGVPQTDDFMDEFQAAFAQ